MVEAGGLDEITEADILGEWRRSSPRNPGVRGAPITRVSIDWTDQQIRFYGTDYLQRSYRAGSQACRSGKALRRASLGHGCRPARGFNVLSSVRQRLRLRQPPDQSFRTRLWVAARELGTLMYLTHRRAGERGRRLLAAPRAPGERGRGPGHAELRGDLRGPRASGGLKFALLDDYANWIKTTPAGGTTLTLSAGSRNVVASGATFAAGDVGATLVLRGSVIPGNRRNRLIDQFTNATHVRMDLPAASNEVITMAGAGIAATWLIAYNHGLPPGGGRQLTYIQEGEESSGEFLDATECFIRGRLERLSSPDAVVAHDSIRAGDGGVSGVPALLPARPTSWDAVRVGHAGHRKPRVRRERFAVLGA
jgi:hypothetical protein